MIKYLDSSLENEDNQAPSNEEGFSLVELMVVVFIMGLLATLIVVNVAPVGDQSRISKAEGMRSYRGEVRLPQAQKLVPIMSFGIRKVYSSFAKFCALRSDLYTILISECNFL